MKSLLIFIPYEFGCGLLLLYFKLGYTTVPAVVALWRQQQGLCQPAALSAAVDLFQRPATYGPVSSSGLLPFCFFFVTDRWGLDKLPPEGSCSIYYMQITICESGLLFF